MGRVYKVTFECYDQENPNEVLSKATVLEGNIEKPTNRLNFSMGLCNQIELIQNVQDHVLLEKIKLLSNVYEKCPECERKLAKCGKHITNFHDVLSDHKVEIQRFKCRKCKYETPSTVRAIINGDLSGDLMRIQSQLGSAHTYRESEEIFDLFSNKPRQVSNHERIKRIVESVGQSVERMKEDEKEIIAAAPASELVINVDGGHIKTTGDNKQSMEAMISVVYRPESIASNSNGTRNYLTSKHCAASIKDDNQELIISGTVVAALKQGLTDKTNVTALC